MKSFSIVLRFCALYQMALNQRGASASGSGGAETQSQWDEDVYVDFDRRNKGTHKSWIWDNYGSLKNRRTGSTYDGNAAYCKV